jgi:hypothetical protein
MGQSIPPAKRVDDARFHLTAALDLLDAADLTIAGAYVAEALRLVEQELGLSQIMPTAEVWTMQRTMEQVLPGD